MTSKKRYTGAELAAEIGVTVQTVYNWIAAGALRKAPIVESLGPGRGGRRCFWEWSDVRRGRRVQALSNKNRPLPEIVTLLGPPD